MGAASASADGKPITFKCESHDLFFGETGTVAIILDKASGTVKEIDPQLDGGGHAYGAESVTIEGDLVKADEGGTSFELNLATGRGTRFIVGEPYSELSCEPN